MKPRRHIKEIIDLSQEETTCDFCGEQCPPDAVPDEEGTCFCCADCEAGAQGDRVERGYETVRGSRERFGEVLDLSGEEDVCSFCGEPCSPDTAIVTDDEECFCSPDCEAGAAGDRVERGYEDVRGRMGESFTFDKYMDRILLSESKQPKIKCAADSALRQRAAKYQDRPANKTRYGVK